MIKIDCAVLVSTVSSSPRHHLTHSLAAAYYGSSALLPIEVPDITLDECILRSWYPRVLFISLDVEDFEDQALQGLDLDKCQIKYLLIECIDQQAVKSALGPTYAVETRLGANDILFKRIAA